MYVKNKLINYKKNIVMSIIPFAEKNEEKKNWNLFDFRSDPDPLFLEADPRIRIHIKMKRIRKTGSIGPNGFNTIVCKDCLFVNIPLILLLQLLFINRFFIIAHFYISCLKTYVRIKQG